MEEGPDMDTEFDYFSPQMNRWPDIKSYRPLNPARREIRLLRIWKQSDRIHAKFEHASLDDSPEYDALSYCWGPPSARRTIYIGDEPVPITKPLFNFLEALCEHGQVLPVWVDLLCIHQADTTERNAQVAMMGDIYRHATSVRAWLGNSDVDIEYSLAYVNALSQRDIRDSPEFKKRATEGLRQICERPYWRRMWIVQEIGLAKVLIVYCGRDRVGFSDLYMAVAETFSDSNVRLLYELQQSICGTKDQVFPSNKTTMEQTSRFRSHACEDLRDKVYAMRSLSRGGRNIVVNYTNDIHELALDVIENHLGLVEFASRPDNPRDEPFQAVALFIYSLELSATILIGTSPKMRQPSLILPLCLGRLNSDTLSPAIWMDGSVLGDGSPLNNALRARTSIYKLPRDSGGLCTINQYKPLAGQWKLLVSWHRRIFYAHVHDGFPQLVGIYVSPDELRDWGIEGRPRNEKTVFDLVLMSYGHIQCCRISRFEPGIMFVHYSWYALLTLACAHEGRKMDRDELLDILEVNTVEIPDGSLCNCEFETIDEKAGI